MKRDTVIVLNDGSQTGARRSRTSSVKLVRTIADLAGCEDIQSARLAEALQYHPKLLLG